MFKKLFNISLKLGTSKTAKNLYWIFSGNAVYIILTFFTTIIIARVITPTEFGIYLALITFGSLVPDLADVGIGTSLCRFIPELEIEGNKEEIRELKSIAWTLEFLLGSAMLILVLVLSPIISKILFAGTSPLLVIIVAIIIWITQLMSFGIYVLSAHKQFRESTLVNLSYAVVRLLILGILVLLKKITMVNILLVYLIAVLLSLLYSFIHTGTGWMRLKYDKKQVKNLLNFSGFLGLQKIFVAVSSRLDMLMLVPLSNAFEAGVYGAASRIAMIYPFGVSGLSQVLAPKMAEFKHGSHAVEFLKKVSLVVGALFLSIIGFLLFSDLVIPVLFGVKYIQAIPVFKGLLIAMIPFVLSVPFVSLVIYTLKKPQIIAIGTFIQLVIIAIANYFYIPQLGRFGPAVGIGLGNLLMLILTAGTSIYYLKNYENRN